MMSYQYLEEEKKSSKGYEIMVKYPTFPAWADTIVDIIITE